MKTGDIILVRGVDFDLEAKRQVPSLLVDLGISWLSKSEYCHAAIAVSSTEIIEAQYGILTRRVVNPYEDYDIYRLADRGLTVGEVERMGIFSTATVGTSYDKLAIFCWFLRLALHWKKKAFWRDNHTYYCSELVYGAYRAAGIELLPNIDRAGDCTPGDLAKSSLLTKVYQ
jgi:uncharacterized protein YycO